MEKTKKIDIENTNCKKLRREWLDCRKQFENKIYPNVLTSFYQKKKCREKYSKYICECAGPFSEQNKRFHCSILATH